ncbi:hypothetical protein WJX72_006820 [[Myrmecia] bisecta]|uniref:Uncharacterized protein n=1 Tax=[Myrmecia] bisecta TaxID=41462 RepID=A0AAW1QFX0_9CHLO
MHKLDAAMGYAEPLWTPTARSWNRCLAVYVLQPQTPLTVAVKTEVVTKLCPPDAPLSNSLDSAIEEAAQFLGGPLRASAGHCLRRQVPGQTFNQVSAP